MTVEFAVQNTTTGTVDEFHTQSIIDVVNQLEADRLTLILLRKKDGTRRVLRVIEDETGAHYQVVCRDVGEWEALR